MVSYLFRIDKVFTKIILQRKIAFHVRTRGTLLSRQ